jgi:hypothetical protein
MLAKVRSIFKQLPEPARDSRGIKPEIPLVDCLMSALAVFGLIFGISHRSIAAKVLRIVSIGIGADETKALFLGTFTVCIFRVG